MVWGNADRLVEARQQAQPFANRLSGVDQAYPMYVLPFSEFMGLEEWSPHQVLKAQGKVKEFDESMWGSIFFISHQWTSYNHPDPGGEQLKALQHVLRKLAAGEMSVKGNFAVEFMYGLKQGHTAEEWKALLPNAYLWIDYTSMPQPLAALPAEQDSSAAPHAGQVSDHRQAEGEMSADVEKLIEELKAAVDSIPTYIERCAEMFILTPSVKHADRAGECCDFNSWRQRGWCRLEFVSSRLACRGDIPVMVITSRETTPQYFNMCDTMKLFAGNGQFTVSDDKFKVKGVLETMLKTKAEAEFAKGNYGLSRGHVLMASSFLAGLPSEEEAAAHEGRAPRTSITGLSELEQIKRDFMFRDDANESEWTRKTGVTLLHVACAVNKLEAVKELLATPEGRQMLNVKIKDIMKLDADVKQYKTVGSATNLRMATAGLTPLAAAMMSFGTSPELIEYLIEQGAQPMDHFAFLAGCMQGSVSNMETYTKALWPQGKDRGGTPAPWINKSFMMAMGGTPMHAVCFMSDRANQKEKLQWLLDNGGKPSLKKKWMLGGSPLTSLSGNEEADAECFDMLVAAGCDPNEPVKPWRLMKGIGGMLKLFKWLRPLKFSAADDFIMMASGGTPMHFAAFAGSIPNIRKLSQHGAGNEKKNRFGQLPVSVLIRKTPDSHAPEILGTALLPPEEKLRSAGMSLAFVSKLKAAKGTDKVLPNPPTVATTATAAS
jgi:hypothetical protein